VKGIGLRGHYCPCKRKKGGRVVKGGETRIRTNMLRKCEAKGEGGNCAVHGGGGAFPFGVFQWKGKQMEKKGQLGEGMGPARGRRRGRSGGKRALSKSLGGQGFLVLGRGKGEPRTKKGNLLEKEHPKTQKKK